MNDAEEGAAESVSPRPSHRLRRVPGAGSISCSTSPRPRPKFPGNALSVRLARPTDKRVDRTFALAERSAGRYSGDAVDVVAGIWDLEVEADHGGERLFRSKNRITLD
jgi:nitrogen fixation protein FixH